MSIDDKCENVSKFEHNFNPEHFYCRLREIGIDKYKASRCTYLYKHIYDQVIKDVKEKYTR